SLMTLPTLPENWNIDRLNSERTQAVAAFGFTAHALRPRVPRGLRALTAPALSACRQHLHTGMRRGEMLALTFGDVDLDQSGDHVAALQAAAGRLESGKSFTSASQTPMTSDVARPDSESASDIKIRQVNNFKAGGPPGDRTRDTVIKSHVLYH